MKVAQTRATEGILKLDHGRTFRFQVDKKGRLVEPKPGLGFYPMEEFTEIVSYSSSLLRSQYNKLRFLWISEELQWVSVRIDVNRFLLKGPVAEVELCVVDPPFGLTVRELDVLTLMAAGFGNEAISLHLGISDRTVAKHVENIFVKTNRWTRSGLAGQAVDGGLLRLPTPGLPNSFPLRTGEIERISSLSSTHKPEVQRRHRRPITIGMPVPLHSSGRADAIEMLDGAQLAADQINLRGGVLDREIRILPIDCDISDGASMAAAISSLAENEVEAIAAGYSCADQKLLDIASNYGAPFLHAATMDQVVEWVRQDPVKYGNVFQTCASDVNYGGGLARFLTDLTASKQWTPHNRKIAVVQPHWPGLDIGLSRLDIQLPGDGWEIVDLPCFPAKGDGWDCTISELHRVDPSVILFASYFAEDSIEFQKAFSASPINSLVYKIYSPSVPTYIQSLGASAEGVIWATTTGLYSDPIGKKFASEFVGRFNRKPGRSQASIAYDRVNILAGAWSRVGSARDFGNVVQDLRSSIYRGVNGSYFLGTDGQVGLTYPDNTADPSISQAHLVFQIQQDRHKIIAPSPYIEGTFELPWWFQGR